MREGMSMLEWIATVLGIACVALAAIRSVWTFPVGVVAVGLLGVVVFEARLYSDAVLQCFFAAANLYGWWNWSRSQGEGGDIPVGYMTRRERLGWLAGATLATIVWSTIMARHTDAAFPFWDGAIAVASVAAQILMARRRVENWAVWVAVDLASIPLYLVKHLYLFAFLYLVYLGLALWGWFGWRAAARPSHSLVPA